MPQRSYNAGGYRYGFNGKENDNEIKGTGNQQDYGMRIYDPRLGRFLSVDPLSAGFPFYSPYHFSGNSPIANIDLDGLEPQLATTSPSTTGTPALRVVINNLVKEGVKRQAKVIALHGTSAGLGLLTGTAAKAGGLTLGFLLSPFTANAPSPPFRFAPLINPFPLPNLDPKQKPGEDEDGNKLTYIYETGSTVKSILKGTIQNEAVLPYFGITDNAFIAGGKAIIGRYAANSERAEYLPKFGAILGKTDRFTAEGVELALIALNTYGKDFDLKVAAGTLKLSSNDVRTSTRIDNLRFSFSDGPRLRAGLDWLKKHYGNEWQETFLHPENPGAASSNGSPKAAQDNTSTPTPPVKPML